MYPTSCLRNLSLTAVIAVLFSGSAFAAYTYQSSTLYEQTDGNIVYVTGGIGERELAELEAAKSEYNVHVSSTDKSGAYVSDTSVVVQDRNGNDLMATNTGPLLMMSLPTGSYKLIAENSDMIQEKRFTVKNNKPTNVYLIWNLPQ